MVFGYFAMAIVEYAEVILKNSMHNQFAKIGEIGQDECKTF